MHIFLHTSRLDRLAHFLKSTVRLVTTWLSPQETSNPTLQPNTLCHPNSKHCHLIQDTSNKECHLELTDPCNLTIIPYQRNLAVVRVNLIINYLQSECIEKYQFKLCSKYDREYGFDVLHR